MIAAVAILGAVCFVQVGLLVLVLQRHGREQADLLDRFHELIGQIHAHQVFAVRTASHDAEVLRADTDEPGLGEDEPEIVADLEEILAEMNFEGREVQL